MIILNVFLVNFTLNLLILKILLNFFVKAIAKLAFDHTERILNLGSDTGFGFFNLVCQPIKRIALVQSPAFA
jgi:hypothetical protein